MKSSIKADLILASKNKETGVILYTFVLTYPRSILAEVNTHRMLSRNTSSSRAIPAKTFRKRIFNDPFVPVSIGQNKKGMQAGEELSGWRRWAAEKVISLARYPMLATNWALEKLGAHKQVMNRYLEPWMWCQQLVSFTDYKNLLKLRNHSDAEPHFHEIAKQVKTWIDEVNEFFAYMEHTHDQNMTLIYSDKSGRTARLQILDPKGNEWHCPFVEYANDGKFIADGLTDWENVKKVSAARCARVSYFLPEGGRSDLRSDFKLVERLSSSGHWSPFEHVAKPAFSSQYFGNFNTWIQYRKEFANEAGGDR